MSVGLTTWQFRRLIKLVFKKYSHFVCFQYYHITDMFFLSPVFKLTRIIMRIFHIHPLAIDNKSMKTLQYLEKRCPHFYSKYNLDKVIRSNFILFSEKKNIYIYRHSFAYFTHRWFCKVCFSWSFNGENNKFT